MGIPIDEMWNADAARPRIRIRIFFPQGPHSRYIPFHIFTDFGNGFTYTPN